IFEHALPRLREKGVKNFYLEVIQKNEPAVRAYEKTGFSIEREMDAFGLSADAVLLELPAGLDVEIRPIAREDLHQAASFFDWKPSWENSLASIQRVPDEVICLGAFKDEKLVGVLAHHPASTWLLSLAVDPAVRRQKVGTALLAALQAQLGEKYHTIKVVNADHSDNGMLRFLEQAGFEFLLNQYEMKLAIKA
ncbi:MAG: GNAT family N-acetyltransferase, partial [Anaerolineales bacterium]